MIEQTDWLSQFLEMVPVRGRLDLRCIYGAPWRIEQPPSANGEMPYHAILAGTAVLQDPITGKPHQLEAGDILLLPHNHPHVLHDGSGSSPIPSRQEPRLNVTLSHNDGEMQALDMLCGRFILMSHHERLMRNTLPPVIIVCTGGQDRGEPGTGCTLASLVALMRQESLAELIGGRAMVNAFSTAMFALILRLASQAETASSGLLALAGNPRLAPALSAMFHDPGKHWSLPDLADLCFMSRATSQWRKTGAAQSPAGLVS
jgi:AraC family transcriptional activator of mtrCDE